VNPRQETFPQMLKFTFCPTFTVRSFIFFITIIDICMYVLTLIVTGAEGLPLNSANFLGPNTKVLRDFGAKNAYLIIKELQLWRLVMPMVLHTGLLHIFFNMFS